MGITYFYTLVLCHCSVCVSIPFRNSICHHESTNCAGFRLGSFFSQHVSTCEWLIYCPVVAGPTQWPICWYLLVRGIQRHYLVIFFSRSFQHGIRAWSCYVLRLLTELVRCLVATVYSILSHALGNNIKSFFLLKEVFTVKE